MAKRDLPGETRSGTPPGGFGAKRRCLDLIARYIVCGCRHLRRRVLRAYARCDLVFPGRTTRTTPSLRRLGPTQAGRGSGLRRGDTQGGEEPMEDVFDVLVEDHEEIRQALAELEKGPTAATGA